MGDRTQSLGPRRGPRARTAFRVLPAAALGVAAALLVSCGSSGSKLIPVANAEPLKKDFQEVLEAARTGNGSCSETEAAILKTEQDFGGLPSTVDSGLRSTLRQGISNLRTHALELCKQPLAQPSQTTTTPKTTTSTGTTPTTPTQTQTTTATTTTSTTPTTPTTSGPGGGTPAPEHEPSPEGGGTKPGENGGGANGGAGAGGLEGGK